MATNYGKIIEENLREVFSRSETLERALPALRRGRQLHFRAFGEDCRLSPDGISFSETTDMGPKALLVSLYAVHARPEPVRLQPFRSFRDLPGSMPYQAAFSANSERVLLPHVPSIAKGRKTLIKAFEGIEDPEGAKGDFSLLLYPLPRVALCYIFYEEDEEFPPSATCLFSSNALSFMPLDGLADLAEYTSREIIRLSGKETK